MFNSGSYNDYTVKCLTLFYQREREFEIFKKIWYYNFRKNKGGETVRLSNLEKMCLLRQTEDVNHRFQLQRQMMKSSAVSADNSDAIEKIERVRNALKELKNFK